MGRCEWCVHSEGVIADMFVFCWFFNETKRRYMSCDRYEREPGSDDNKD